MSTDASPHSQVRHALSPTTTELVIDGAVYSVEGIKQLIGRELTRTHLINGIAYTTETVQRALDVYYNSGAKSGPPADAAGADAEPRPESTIERIGREMREKDAAAKEDILTAFVAKYGAAPEEVEVVENGLHWYVRPRDGHAERSEAMNDRAKLITFFRTDQGSSMGGHGDAYGWSPGRTAVHFLSEFANRVLAKPSRAEIFARVTMDLSVLGMPQVVPIVRAYESLREAVEGVKATFPGGVPAQLAGVDSDDEDEDDEHDR